MDTPGEAIQHDLEACAEFAENTKTYAAQQEVITDLLDRMTGCPPGKVETAFWGQALASSLAG